MKNMKEVNGIVMPCTVEDEAYIAQKEADFSFDQIKKSKVAYLEKRKSSYPPIQDQLLALWNSMDTGEIPKSKEFYTAIKLVNDEHPPPV